MSNEKSPENVTKKQYLDLIEQLARSRNLIFEVNPRGRQGDSLEFRISDGSSEVFGTIKESEGEEIWLGVSDKLLEFTGTKNLFVIIVDKLMDRCLVVPFTSVSSYMNPLRKDDFIQQAFVITRTSEGYIMKKRPHESLDRYIENLELVFKAFEKVQTHDIRPIDASEALAQKDVTSITEEDVTHEISVDELPMIGDRTLDERVKEKIYYVDEVKLEQANAQHRRLVSTFIRFFREKGLDPKPVTRADLVTISGNYVWLFEMKSLTEDNEKKQVRNGIGQLFDYEFIELSKYRLVGTYKINKALVFERKPLEETINFLHYTRIFVFWLDGTGGIRGDLDDLLETLPTN